MHVLSVIHGRRRGRSCSRRRSRRRALARRVELRLGHAAAAPARSLRRGARLRRRDARRPGRRTIPGCATRRRWLAAAARHGRRCSASASACSCSRARRGAWVGRCRRPGDRLVRRRADRRRRRRSGARRAAAARSTRCSGTTTPTACPTGAVELARSAACTQAFRLGDACWGVQFHPEVTQAQLDGWIVDTTIRRRTPTGCARRRARRSAAGTSSGERSARAFLEAAENLLALRSSRVA